VPQGLTQSSSKWKLLLLFLKLNSDVLEIIRGNLTRLFSGRTLQIMSRFPLHTAVARSYLSAMLHEATCERTFSYSGRLLTKQRLQIDPNQVGASAECTAGEAIFEMSAAEIKKHYQSKRKRKADANE